MSQTLTQKSSLAKTEGINKSWSFTNKSGTDIVAINAYTNQETPAEQLYEQSLTLLATGDGQKYIKNQSAATIILSGGGITNSVIIARSDNFFPIKIIDVSDSAASVTITADDTANLKKAEGFYKTITAFASSTMATGFAAAVKDGDTAKIDAFFLSYPEYATCTLDMVVAVISYYSRFPFAWTGNAATKTYYLYTSDGTTNKFTGSVALENKLPIPLSSFEISEGFTADYITTNGADSTSLYYLNGQFVDDLESESPSFCFQGLYVQKSQLDKTGTGDAIIAVLKGTVNGTDVFGYEVKQERDKDGFFSNLDVLHHPEDTQAWLNLLGVAVTGAFGLAVLGIGAKCLIDFIKTKMKLTHDEVAAKNVEIRAKNRARTQTTLDKINKKLKIPEDVNTSLDRIKREGNELLLKENKNKLNDAAATQQAMYDKLIEYGNPTAMKKVYNKLEELAETLLETNSQDLGGKMPGLLEDLKSNASVLTAQAKMAKSKFSASENKALEASSKVLEKIAESIEKNEEIRDELIEDEIPEIPIEE